MGKRDSWVKQGELEKWKKGVLLIVISFREKRKDEFSKSKEPAEIAEVVEAD
jgi:hypothetical protein